ncbi:hypothetical protein BH23BAC3_BH23BAC3_07640 [soil metagenome]
MSGIDIIQITGHSTSVLAATVLNMYYDRRYDPVIIGDIEFHSAVIFDSQIGQSAVFVRIKIILLD